jgi:hypothetical protein
MKQNTIICSNCGSENPFYKLTCIKCSAFLRERIFNIDLWDVLSKLIDSPSSAYTRIIQAEHKNFIFFILFFVAVKLSINSVFISLALEGERHYVNNVFIVFGISLGILITSILITALLYTLVLSARENKTRFRDNFSVLTYSFMPYVFALVIIFPVELILFGYTVFSVNPHPFIIKETVAYIMMVFEILVIIWTIFLSYMALRKQSGDFITAMIFAIILNVFIYSALYISARYIYII